MLATVDFWGVRKQVRLDIVDEPVAPGDYVLNHVGFAIRRIPAEEIGETLALYESCCRRPQDDLMARTSAARSQRRRLVRQRAKATAMTVHRCRSRTREQLKFRDPAPARALAARLARADGRRSAARRSR